MMMRSAAAATATATATTATVAPARAGRYTAGGQRHGGSEHGQLLLQFNGPAMGARRALPIAGAYQHFAVLPALRTMKLVNRHACNVPVSRKKTRAGAGIPEAVKVVGRFRCVLGGELRLECRIPKTECRMNSECRTPKFRVPHLTLQRGLFLLTGEFEPEKEYTGP
jgi:hypothetical protein